jgi:anion-transporting  ArsA/GET3 family ATPase
MRSLLDRELLVITGKGGVGKTTMSAAIGVLAASQGRRAIVVEVGDQSQMPALFGRSPGTQGVEVELEQRLSSISIDPDKALLEWLQSLAGRLSGRVLASSGTFQYFAAAAPGAKELVSMIKIWQLTRGERGRRRTGGHDLVVIDAPATGHALGMLRSPQTFGAIARVGPIAKQTQQVRDLLSDPARTAFMAVALGTEMAVTETLELEDNLSEQLERSLDTVIVNGLLPRRFTPAELEQIDVLHSNGGRLARGPSGSNGRSSDAAVRDSAARAAHAVHERARFQHNQVTRLRRRHFEVLAVPFMWGAELDLSAVREIAERLGRKL